MAEGAGVMAETGAPETGAPEGTDATGGRVRPPNAGTGWSSTSSARSSRRACCKNRSSRMRHEAAADVGGARQPRKRTSVRRACSCKRMRGAGR